MRGHFCRTSRWRNFRAWHWRMKLYLEGGIRSVEIGTLMFGEHATMDLVRLAISAARRTRKAISSTS